MILKRFTTLSLLTRQQPRNISGFKFSTTQAQPQAQQQATITNQALNQAIKDTKPQHYKRSHQRPHRRYQGSRSHQDNYQDVVSQFLLIKEQQANPSLINIFKKFQTNPTISQEQLSKLIDKQFLDFQTNRNKPFQSYEKKLNLLPEKLIYGNIKLDGSTGLGESVKNYHFQKNLKSDTLDTLGFQEIRRNYQAGYYQVSFDGDFVKDLTRAAVEARGRGFLVNLVYEHFAQSGKFPLQASQVNRLLDLIASGQLPEANALKFYWIAIKTNPNLLEQISPLILSQLKKLKINGNDATKQLKSISYFFLGSQLSTKIITKIFQTSPNLDTAIKLWFATVLISSRIQDCVQNQGKININVNMNDIFANLNKDKQVYSRYLQNTLPKLFMQSNIPNIFQIYKNALKRSQNINDRQGIILSQLQNKFNTQSPNSLYLQYPHAYNFQSQKIYLLEKQINKQYNFNKNNSNINNININIVESIIKGQYQTALKTYIKVINAGPEDYQQINRYFSQARTVFHDQNSQALYVLKQLFKDSKKKLDPYRQNLTQERLNRFLESRNNVKTWTEPKFPQEQRQQIRVVSASETGQNKVSSQKPFFGSKAKKAGKKVAEANEANEQQPQAQHTQHTKQPQQKSKGVFGKRQPSNKFSTTKNIPQQNPDKTQSNLHYQNYLKAVKDAQKSAEVPLSVSSIFNFNTCKSVQQVSQQFKKNINQLNQNNISEIIATYQNIPLVGNIKTLIRYYLLTITPNNQPIPQLKVQFASSFGDVSKDYGAYLKDCALMFALPNEIYDQILTQLESKYQRHKFKRVVAHLLLFKKNLSDQVVSKICQICSKQKIGLTLLEIIQLINVNSIEISYNSLKKIASSIQNFKNMESDLLNFVRQYCDRSNFKIQTKLFEPYIVNLTFTERYEALNGFFDTLRQQFKVKQYKINPKLTPEQNLKAQKLYKQIELEKANNQLFEMVRIVAASLKPRTTIPPFVVQIYEQYLSKKKGPMKSHQNAIGLILYSQTKEKFVKLLQSVKANPEQNTVQVLNAQIRALSLFGRSLKDQTDRILKCTLFEKQFDLDQAQLKGFGNIFKQLDIPGSYSQYLQYVLKKQPKISPQIKSLYYKIFNSTTDDFSKNQISGLLDYIFNPTKEKQRIQYKKVKQQEEKKSKILQSIGARKQIQLQQQAAKQRQAKAKVEKVQKKVQTDLAVAKDKKKTKKQQKKQKKQQKKQKSQQKKSGQSKAKSQGDMPIDTKVDVFQKNRKRQAKYLSKLSSCFTYDENNKIVFNSKLSKRDLRTKSTTHFIQNFMHKYDLSNEDDLKLGKQNKLKKGAKVGKQASKQVAKKSATKQKK